MMDLKEIIKWFIPCFHILQIKKNNLNIFVCLLFIVNFSLISCAEIKSVVSENSLNLTKNVTNDIINLNSSEVQTNVSKKLNVGEPRTVTDTSVSGRTFGRPFKKMIAGLLPIIFQVGAASTWAVVAAIVGVKTLLVSMFILKLLLIAGAAKLGALFANKQQHQHHGWQPPHQKEIHLHIHNGGHEHQEEHLPVSAWSREGITSQDSKVAYVYDPPPYRSGAVSRGPQTITTPFGNYVKIDAAPPIGNT